LDSEAVRAAAPADQPSIVIDALVSFGLATCRFLLDSRFRRYVDTSLIERTQLCSLVDAPESGDFGSYAFLPEFLSNFPRVSASREPETRASLKSTENPRTRFLPRFLASASRVRADIFFR